MKKLVTLVIFAILTFAFASTKFEQIAKLSGIKLPPLRKPPQTKKTSCKWGKSNFQILLGTNAAVLADVLIQKLDGKCFATVISSALDTRSESNFELIAAAQSNNNVKSPILPSVSQQEDQQKKNGVKAQVAGKAVAKVVKVGGKEIIVNTVSTTHKINLKNVLCEPKKKKICGKDSTSTTTESSFIAPITINGKTINLQVKANLEAQSDLVLKKQTKNLCTLTGLLKIKATLDSVQVAKKNAAKPPQFPVINTSRALTRFGCLKAGVINIAVLIDTIPGTANQVIVSTDATIQTQDVGIKCPKKMK